LPDDFGAGFRGDRAWAAETIPGRVFLGQRAGGPEICRDCVSGCLKGAYVLPVDLEGASGSMGQRIGTYQG
jgi:hypothetical protein